MLEREEIYQRVWGYTMAHGDRSVDVFVRKLRSKFQQVSPDWNYIHTHFGVGYRFAAEPAGSRRRRPPSRCRHGRWLGAEQPAPQDATAGRAPAPVPRRPKAAAPRRSSLHAFA